MIGDPGRLVAATDGYRAARPFPHVVLDGVFDDGLLEGVVAEMPALDDARWLTYKAERERGKRFGGPPLWGPSTRRLFGFLARNRRWLAAIGQMTGIADLRGSRRGSGYMVSAEGARLGTHVDFNRERRGGRHRRVNLLLFLNREWREEWGGVLELHDDDGLARAVLPTWNRLVVFNTSDRSWHGHPEPVAPGRERRSFATYYFSAEPPPGYRRDHSTIYREDRP